MQAEIWTIGGGDILMEVHRDFKKALLYGHVILILEKPHSVFLVTGSWSFDFHGRLLAK